MFQLESSFSPAGDQPKAIEQLLAAYDRGDHIQTLLGATGTGKTFTMAHLVQHLQRPTLVVSHNKTLAAQLATEFKHFFPKNAVHYFVSYFDYYQPESYLPDRDMYIEKEATINQEIEMYRLGALASLLSRPDVIIVASVSALYGLGQKDHFAEHTLKFVVWHDYDFREVKAKLLAMQYQPVQSSIEQGMFDIKGEMIDIYSSIEKKLYRLLFNEDSLEHIVVKDPLSFADQGSLDAVTIRPSTQYMQDMSQLESILSAIHMEMLERVSELERMGNDLEANRIKKRVEYDIRMIRETGFTNGIENYSLYFDGRKPGEPPTTLFDYFPDDFLMIIDESHMTVPQLKAMPQADRSRKSNLIKFGFRLPSAMDHRPLNFPELEGVMGWESIDRISNDLNFQQSEYFQARLSQSSDTILQYHTECLLSKHKPHAKTLFVSATPSYYELQHSPAPVEQIIRPTGLLDPVAYVYPKSGDYPPLLASVDQLLTKKPYLQSYYDGYDDGQILFD